MEPWTRILAIIETPHSFPSQQTLYIYIEFMGVINVCVCLHLLNMAVDDICVCSPQHTKAKSMWCGVDIIQYNV